MKNDDYKALLVLLYESSIPLSLKNNIFFRYFLSSDSYHFFCHPALEYKDFEVIMFVYKIYL